MAENRKRTFVVFTDYGELLDVAMQLQAEGNEVLMYIENHDYKKIGDGIIEKQNDWWRCIGEDYIWLFDGCAHGDLQDWLREQGEIVFGGSKQGDRLENERQLAQDWFKAAGFEQPESTNFTNIDAAIKYVQSHSDKRWVLKQNGDAPKSINHIGKFEDNSDMLFHLEEMKKKWNEAEYGQFNCDLMEFVDGFEVAASVFFNGEEYMKDKNGKVVGFLNMEEKKEVDGNMGETTGEMGTSFIGVDETSDLFSEILIRPKILEVLQASKFRGVFDINCIKTPKGIVALEPTMRPGIPASSYEFIEGLDMPTGDMIEAVAQGSDTSIEIKKGVGMVMVVAAKPYPVEADMEQEATSMGEKLWPLKDGKPTKDFSNDQMQHIHLENFEKCVDEITGENSYRVATKNGYLLTVTGREGKTIKQVRENLIQYIKDNIYISGMKIRHDIGKRVEEYYGK